MTKEKFFKDYLNRYLNLEEDFKSTFEFVSVDKENYKTYSDHYLKIILDVGSEIYVIEKLIIDLFGIQYDPNNYDAHILIEKNIQNIKSLKVIFKENNEVIKPWKKFIYSYPSWKAVYNNIKHSRSENAINEIKIGKQTVVDSRFDANKKWYQYANLENVIIMFSVLHSLEMIAYKKIIEDNNAKIVNHDSIVPNIKCEFRITNQDWKDIQYSDGIIIENGTLILGKNY